jgi:hypothetical protein
VQSSIYKANIIFLYSSSFLVKMSFLSSSIPAIESTYNTLNGPSPILPTSLHNNCSVSSHSTIFLSLFLLLPLWSIGHPWNALFHFSFLILRQSVRLLAQGISPSQSRYLHKTTQTQNKRRQTWMPCVVFSCSRSEAPTY